MDTYLYIIMYVTCVYPCTYMCMWRMCTTDELYMIHHILTYIPIVWFILIFASNIILNEAHIV